MQAIGWNQNLKGRYPVILGFTWLAPWNFEELKVSNFRRLTCSILEWALIYWPTTVAEVEHGWFIFSMRITYPFAQANDQMHIGDAFKRNDSI